MHVDMNAFFASVEQRANPALRGRPIAVTGSAGRTVITTSSYEARAFGVKTGMNRYEAKKLCPEIIFVVGDNRKYVDTSIRIVEIIKRYSPVVEVYSIDEAFVDISGTASLFGTPLEMGASIKRDIKEATGLDCSVGVGPNKLIAKLAGEMEKPDGLVIIETHEVEAVLKDLPVKELWGIGSKLTKHLGAMGVRTCGELAVFPVRELKARFGIVGEKLSLMGRGIYEGAVVPEGREPGAKSVGHSTTLPRDVSDSVSINRYLLKLSEMVGARARRHALKGRKVTLTLRYSDFYTFTRQRTLVDSTNDTHTVYKAVRKILASIELRSAVRLIGVTLSDMTEGVAGQSAQLDLFEDEERSGALLEAMDSINREYGRFTLTWGSLFVDDDASWVIAPSWRPTGVRRY
ncbi:MAG: DNA polymerase IV [Proteobacteria bacterium]|nr:DNA polymerase IV [Pseudomonadota bacterium]